MTTRHGPLRGIRTLLGSHVAPPRFVLFVVAMLGAGAFWHWHRGHGWGDALVLGFDLGVMLFTASLWPLTADHGAEQMRRHAQQNDANRAVVLVIAGCTVLAIMTAITAELPAAHKGEVHAIVKLVGTLGLAWVFLNLVFMMHYAHMHYTRGRDGVHDRCGFEFPGTPEPDYWDFFYFAFTAGMSFAASDVNVTRGEVRRVVVLHSFLAFLFNIGALAFSINVLAGAAS